MSLWLVVMFGAIVLGNRPGGVAARPSAPSLRKRSPETTKESYYMHRSSIAPEPTPLLKACCEGGRERALSLACAVAVSSTFLSRLPFLARPRTILHQDRLRYRWRLVYSVPYVAKVAVTKLHWLNKSEMTDGFALAETTPGPLIIVVAFVGS